VLHRHPDAWAIPVPGFDAATDGTRRPTSDANSSGDRSSSDVARVLNEEVALAIAARNDQRWEQGVAGGVRFPMNPEARATPHSGTPRNV